MNKETEHVQNQDEVDKIVDALVADPTRANDVKALLKRKIAAPDIVTMVIPRATPSKVAVSEDESEDDLWDNVPV